MTSTVVAALAPIAGTVISTLLTPNAPKAESLPPVPPPPDVGSSDTQGQLQDEAAKARRISRASQSAYQAGLTNIEDESTSAPKSRSGTLLGS